MFAQRKSPKIFLNLVHSLHMRIIIFKHNDYSINFHPLAIQHTWHYMIMQIDIPTIVTRFYETIPNHTSGQNQINAYQVDSYTIVLLV